MNIKHQIPELCVLSVLKKYSDKNHTLSQKQIKELVLSEYGEELHRDTIRTAIKELIDFNVPIKFRDPDPDKETHMRDLYYEHEINEEDLRTLINYVIRSDYIFKENHTDLIENLKGLTSKYFELEEKAQEGDVRFIIMHEVSDGITEEEYQEYNKDIILIAKSLNIFSHKKKIAAFSNLHDAKKELAKYKCSAEKDGDVYYADVYCCIKQEYDTPDPNDPDMELWWLDRDLPIYAAKE